MGARSYCGYHPTKPALHHCPRCSVDLCADCVVKRRQTVMGKATGELFLCPKCNLPADQLSVGSFIDPFWTRLPRFFAYPLQPKPFLLILMLSMVGLVFHKIPFLRLILSGVLIKYSYAVLRNTVEGNLRPPDLSYEVLGEDFGQAFKQIALFTVVGLTVAMAAGRFGSEVALLYAFLVILLVPAMIIVLAVSDSLVAALNPVSFVTIAYRIGWGYLLMYLFLALLLGAPLVLAELFGDRLSPGLQRFLLLLANHYYTIVAYNLMGYVMLQYHDEVGYEVRAEDFRDQSPVLKTESPSSDEKEQAKQALLNQVNVLIKDGRAEDAVSLMRERMGAHGGDPVLCERYYNLLKITRQTSELLTHAVTWLDLLASENEKAPACDVYKECLSLDPQFVPHSDALFKIATWCMEEGDVKHGLNALAKFLRADPEHALIPKALYLFGKNAYEKLHDSSRAEKALRSLQQKYPNHELADHARKFLERIKRQEAAVAR